MRNAAMGGLRCYVFMPPCVAEIVGNDIKDCGFGFSPGMNRNWYCISWENNESV